MRNKLEAKSTKTMLVGYSTSQKGYKCFDPTARRVLVSREVKFMEEKGYYDGKNWEELESLSQPSDQAASLRNILEELGIGVSQDQSGRSEPAPVSAEEQTHFEHQGGSESEAEGLGDQGSGEAGDLGNQGSDSPVQSGEESVRENQNEDQEAGEENQIQEEPIEEQVVVPLRRSTREKRDPSNWVNTRVCYNAQAVEL